ncbi:ATP-binding protein [Streptacidiphilus pinicola]|uniref:ATP-binding protein n=1 Tax=Streptacidiphilus pinicola TaxID=2219663 RepID=A0A2X0J8I3_9ACTN|nr:ATP-binding protein [Streptacidiphilus pinicola]RAG83798.1 ATP-binding protein [Streptacidiphilus pinicola]
MGHIAVPGGGTTLHLKTRAGPVHRAEESLATQPPSWVRDLVFETPVRPEAVPTAREWLRERFGQIFDQEVLSDLQLVLTELVTNAVTASPKDELVRVALRQVLRGLLIEVTDTSPQAPRLRQPTARDQEGRGLVLVSAICPDWGWHPQDPGKVVWALYQISDSRNEAPTSA